MWNLDPGIESFKRRKGGKLGRQENQPTKKQIQNYVKRCISELRSIDEIYIWKKIVHLVVCVLFPFGCLKFHSILFCFEENITFTLLRNVL